MAENLGMTDAVWQAVHEHLRKIGETPAGEAGEAEGEAATDATSPEVAGEETALETSRREAETDSGFLYLNRT